MFLTEESRLRGYATIEIDNSRLNIERLAGGGEFVYKPFVKLDKVLVSVVENGMYFPVNYNEQDLI